MEEEKNHSALLVALLHGAANNSFSIVLKADESAMEDLADLADLGNASSEEDETSVYTFEFVVHGLLILVFGVFGLVGNVLCLVVLSLPSMKNTINCLLTGLVLVDIVILLSALTLFTLPAFQVSLKESLE